MTVNQIQKKHNLEIIVLYHQLEGIRRHATAYQIHKNNQLAGIRRYTTANQIQKKKHNLEFNQWSPTKQVPVKISAQNHTEAKIVENNTLFVLLFIQDIFVMEQETLHPCSHCAWLLFLFFVLFNNTCCKHFFVLAYYSYCNI